MAIVINPNSISINSIKYPVVGLLRPTLITPPEKMVTGDYDQNTDPNLSIWDISDNSGGMLCERMLSEKEKNRFWYSSVDTRWPGHLLLPPLATALTFPDLTAPTISNSGFETGNPPSSWTDDGLGCTIAQVADPYAGTYAIELTVSLNDAESGVYQDLSWDTKYRNATCVFTCYGKKTTANGPHRIYINDGVGTTYSDVSTSAGYAQLTVTRRIAATATKLRLGLLLDGQAAEVRKAVFDTAAISFSRTTLTPVQPINYNNNLYWASGQTLFKLNATGDGWGVIYDFSATITSMAVSVDNYLYICLGDADEYWYMDTTEAFTETDELNGTLSVHWDDKYFTADSAGLLHYYTDPHTANPTVHNVGQLPVSDNDLQELLTYRDADGDQIIYGSTKTGLWAHDYANTKWLQTELVLPNHATAGKAAAVWHSGLYISYGLGATKYIAGTIADIAEMGLDQDDGLPASRGGEFVNFAPGHKELFAVIDSTYEGTTSHSTVMAWNDIGWHNMYEHSTHNIKLYKGIASPVFAYRYWVGTPTGTVWLPLYRNIVNPTKISTYTYAASGSHWTPWFDAFWPGGSKLATKFVVNVAGASATETVVVKYRTDYSNTDLDTGWTTLGTITASGDTTYTFASSVGISFKAIQFRFDLARGGTTTVSPDIRWAQLYFFKNTTSAAGTGAWEYEVDVDCSGEYGGRSPSQLLDAIKAAAVSSTLIPVGFEEDVAGTATYYGRVKAFTGARQTGQEKQGIFTVDIVVPA